MNATEARPGLHPPAHGGAGPLLAVLMAFGTPATAADASPPEQVLAKSADAIADAVAKRHDELARDPRRIGAFVDEFLRPHFDLDTSCRLILGPHWKSATPAQRQRFIAAFQGYLVANYGHAMLEFTHDTVAVWPQQDPVVGTSTQVHTTMKLTSGQTYKVDFYMRLDEQGWRIVDVLVEGVSYVRSYRGDFGLEVRSTGLDAVSARLEAFARDKLAKAH